MRKRGSYDQSRARSHDDDDVYDDRTSLADANSTAKKETRHRRIVTVISRCFFPENVKQHSRTMMMMVSVDGRAIVRSITRLSYLWIICSLLLASTRTGKIWLSGIVSTIFKSDDEYLIKSGIPLITLGLPILLSSSLIHLWSLQRDGGNLKRSTSVADDRQDIPWALQQRLLEWLRIKYPQRRGLSLTTRQGDIDFDRYAIALIFIPCVLYSALSIYRHSNGNEISPSKQLSGTANVFGVAALICMSVFLIPVARHSVVLRLFGWNPVAAARLHVWSGRIIVVASFLHGAMHIYKWTNVAGLSFLSMISPPRQCWSPFAETSDQILDCGDTGEPVDQLLTAVTGCSCYGRFRNLFGVCASICLVIIGLSSLQVVRRRSYSVFYRIHIIAGPLVLVCTILHWEKSILYLVGGISYYVASTFPVLAEYATGCENNGTVQLVSAERIPSDSHKSNKSDNGTRPCISLTFVASEAATKTFRPGQYVKLIVPEISSVMSHPFTVNVVPNRPNQIRIIFRDTGGPFTTGLAKQVESAQIARAKIPVSFILDGYHGQADRMEQALRHDTIALVAGGIGITPYLSLLHYLYEYRRSEEEEFLKTSNHARRQPSTLRKVVLHWVCRDASLIEYARKEYIDPLLRLPQTPSLEIQIVIHDTTVRDAAVQLPLRNYASFEQHCYEDAGLLPSTNAGDASLSRPFTPSKLAPSLDGPIRDKIVPSVSFFIVSWVGLYTTWKSSLATMGSRFLLPRMLGPLLILLLASVVSLTAKVLTKSIARRKAKLQSQMPSRTYRDTASRLEASSLELPTPRQDVPPISICDEEAPVDCGSGKGYVPLIRKTGRPPVDEFLSILDKAEHAGLFVCGPKALTDDIRDKLHQSQSSCNTLQHCGCTRPSISLYEESFEM